MSNPATNTDQTAPATPLSVCPACQRKLLSTRSILCNWCGARIDDPAYLERAAQQRAEGDAQLRAQMEREMEETAKMGIIGRLKKHAKSAQVQRRDTLLLPPTDKL